MIFFDNQEVHKVVLNEAYPKTRSLILEHIKEIGEDRVFVVCMDDLSIEGWIHSNRRNRLGQKLVECLVSTHTNLKLEQRL
jgi:hypothetical protein